MLYRALVIGIIVGTVLNLLNHWEALTSLSIDSATLVRLLVTPVVPFLVSLISSLLAERSNPTQQLTQTLEKVVEGDLAVTLDTEHHPKLGQLRAALASHLQKLKSDFHFFFGVSYDVASVSTSVTNHAQELSTQAKSIAASVESIRRLLSELSDHEHKMASAMNLIDESSGKVDSIAKQNQEATNEVQVALHKISELVSSQLNHCTKIADFSKSIEDLSFQSKILSFNASVEAARAGEAGEGFSVVADEIHSLSVRSKKQTLEIRDKASGLMQSIGELVELTETAVEKTVSNNQQSHQISQLVGEQSEEIANLAIRAEQSVRQISQVSEDLGTLEEGVRYNEEFVAQLTQQAEELHLGSKRLRETIQSYRGVVNATPKNVCDFLIHDIIPKLQSLRGHAISKNEILPPQKNYDDKAPDDVYKSFVELYRDLQTNYQLNELQKIDNLDILPTDVHRLLTDISKNLPKNLGHHAPENLVNWLTQTPQIRPQDSYQLAKALQQWANKGPLTSQAA